MKKVLLLFTLTAFFSFVSGSTAAQSLDWAKQAGGADTEYAGDIALDDSGNSYVTGNFSGTTTFGVGEINETSLTSAGFADIFVAKYSCSGAFLWVKQAGGMEPDEGKAIAAMGDGTVYVTGSFQDTAIFGEGEINETSLTASGWSDVFVAT